MIFTAVLLIEGYITAYQAYSKLASFISGIFH